jgi:hypothetical protein
VLLRPEPSPSWAARSKDAKLRWWRLPSARTLPSAANNYVCNSTTQKRTVIVCQSGMPSGKLVRSFSTGIKGGICVALQGDPSRRPGMRGAESLTADEGYDGSSSAGESSVARWCRTRSLRAASMSSSAGVSRSMKFRRNRGACALAMVDGSPKGFAMSDISVGGRWSAGRGPGPAADHARRTQRRPP